MSEVDDEAVVVERLQGWVRSVHGRLPLYSRLVETALGHRRVHRLLLAAPPEQRIPVLLLAAVHALVLDHPDSALARHYPNLTEHPAGDDPAPAFLEFCADHEAELSQLIATRTVQTNEVGRCALLLPVLGMLEREGVGPLAMVDVGTSAGLNLGIDRYRYSYVRDGEPFATIAGDGALGEGRRGDELPGVELSCSLRRDVPLPTTMPAIAARVGLDRTPVDLADPAQVRWLEACVWPEQPERFHRLRAATAVVRALRPDVRAGDAVDDLSALVSTMAGEGHPVVVNTWVLNYLDAEQRRRYVAALGALGQSLGHLSWVYAESPSAVGPDVPVSDRADLVDATVLSLVRWRSGERDVQHLASAHPHGHWLNWI